MSIGINLFFCSKLNSGIIGQYNSGTYHSNYLETYQESKRVFSHIDYIVQLHSHVACIAPQYKPYAYHSFENILYQAMLKSPTQP